MRRLFVIGLACATFGCAQRLDQLEPFPCSTEGECPPANTSGLTAAQAHDASYRCVAGGCVRPSLWTACQADDECPSASACHPELRRCAPKTCDPYTATFQRDPSTVSLGGACWPVCLGDANCVGDETCQPIVAGRSVCVKKGKGLDAACTTSADCRLGTSALCVRGRCAAECAADNACRAGEKCVFLDPKGNAKGVCWTSCAGGKVCPAGLTCAVTGSADGVPWCLAAGVRPGAACTPTTVTAPCGGSLFCGDASSNRCWTPCEFSSMCGAGYDCSNRDGTGRCLPTCEGTEVCPAGLTCTWAMSGRKLCH